MDNVSQLFICQINGVEYIKKEYFHCYSVITRIIEYVLIMNYSFYFYNYIAGSISDYHVYALTLTIIMRMIHDSLFIYVRYSYMLKTRGIKPKMIKVNELEIDRVTIIINKSLQFSNIVLCVYEAVIFDLMFGHGTGDVQNIYVKLLYFNYMVRGSLQLCDIAFYYITQFMRIIMI